MSENNKNANDYAEMQCNKDFFIISSEGVANPAEAPLPGGTCSGFDSQGSEGLSTPSWPKMLGFSNASGI